MKWTTAIPLTLFLGLLALVVGSLLGHEPEDPLEALEQLTEDYRNGLVELPEALDRLGSFLEDADDLEIDTEIRFLRARSVIYKELGALTQARDDLETMRGLLGGRGGPELELAIADLTASEGRTADAASYAFNVVQSSPENPAAWALLGRLERQLSRAAQDTATAEVAKLVDRSSAVAIGELIAEYCTRDSDDPRKSAVLGQLNALLRDKTNTTLPEVFNSSLEEASKRAESARNALAQALELRADGQSIEQLADSLAAVGRADDAASFLIAALALSPSEPDAKVLLAAAERLAESAQTARLWPYVSQWDWKNLEVDIETLGELCRVFYEAREPGLLSVASQPLRNTGGNMGVAWSRFYSQAAQVFAALRRSGGGTIQDSDQRARLAGAADILRGFGRNTDNPRPFPGAATDAFLLVAQAHRLLNNVGAERSALHRALEDPNATSAMNVVRLAELQGQSGVQRAENVERLITRAIDLDPTLSLDLLPRWVQASDDALLEAGLDFEELYEDAVEYGDGRPMREVGPATLWRMARRHLDSGHSFSAARLAEDLLAEYPRLLPAIDLQIEADLSFGGRYEIGDRLIRRIELGGADASIESFIRAAESELTGETLENAILADPERFGRPAAAELALSEGYPKRAIRMLEDLASAQSSPSIRWLRARAFIAAERFAEAVPDLESLLDDAQLGVAANEHLLIAYHRMGDTSKLSALVDRALTEFGGVDRLEAVLSTLNRLGRADDARRLLAALDQYESTRTPAFFRGLVLHSVQSGDASLISEAMDRASAYVEDGTAELAGVILDVSSRDWLSLPIRVGQLRERANPDQGSLDDAILCLLEERVQDGLRIAERGLAAQPRSALWALVRSAAIALERQPQSFPAWFGPNAAEQAVATLLGSRRVRRDPREFLTLLLLRDRSEWHVWVQDELERVKREGGGTLWPDWLLSDLARGDQRKKITQGLKSRFPKFGPTWQRVLDEARQQHANDPLARELLQAHVQRRNRLGPRAIEDPIEVAIAESARHILRDEPDEAFSSLSVAVTREAREDFEVLFMLGQLLLERGQPGLALLHFERAATLAPPASHAAAADALVAAIEAASAPGAATRGALDPEEAVARLEEAVGRFPKDPLVALAALKASVRHANTGAAQADSLARRQVSRLRRAMGEATLEELRPGSTSAWVDWCKTLAPRVGAEIVEADLDRRPGDVTLWSLRAELLASQGAVEQADAHDRVVISIEPDARSLLARAGRSTYLGTPRKQVNDMLREVRRLGDADDGALADMILSSMRLQGTPYPRFELVLEPLESNWEERGTLREETRFELGLQLIGTYVQAAASHPRPGSQEGISAEEQRREHRDWQLTQARRAGVVLDELDELATAVHDERLLRVYRGVIRALLREVEARES